MGADADTADPMSKTPLAEFPQAADAVPVNIEEHRLVDSQTSDRASSAMEPDVEPKQPAKQRFAATEGESLEPADQAIKNPQSTTPQQHNPIQPAIDANQGESLDVTNDSTVIETDVLTGIPSNETSVRSKTTTIETPPTESDNQRATAPADRSSAPVSTPVLKEIRVVREQVWHRVYRQVIDWVADQPVNTTRQQQEQIADKLVKQLQQKVPGVVQTESFPLDESRQALTSRRESEIGDLHLAIGKLEVSIDQPAQREGQPQRQQETTRSKPVAAPVSRRLRRRYITP
jgi:hypothetical protein